jgi:hypothetical protein
MKLLAKAWLALIVEISWLRHQVARGIDKATSCVLPQPCLADLRQRVASSPQYRVEQCNLVEQCWVRHDGEAIYTISFYPDYAGFHFEKRQPAGE